jgi:large exoprotein involved in heme utilization and adhesion
MHLRWFWQSLNQIESRGIGGDVTLQEINVLLIQNGEISASTRTGTAGNIILNCDGDPATQLFLTGNDTRIAVEPTNGGTAGNLTLRSTTTQLESGATLSVSSPEGQAGILSISTQNLELNQAQITAETGSSGDEAGAIIDLQISGNLLLLQDNSLISAQAFNQANGGNVTIDLPAGFVIAVPEENSDIIANAIEGNGGRINITTLGLFGIEFRPVLTPLSDVTASSQFGVAGEVVLNTLGINPSQGLVELPTLFVDASRLIAQECKVDDGGIASIGEFFVTGRGGLAPDPSIILRPDLQQGDWITLDDDQSQSLQAPQAPIAMPSTHETESTSPIVEAAGWSLQADGSIQLVAAQRQAPLFMPLNCGRN